MFSQNPLICNFLCLTGVPQKLTTALETYNKHRRKPAAVIITASEYCHKGKNGDEGVIHIISYPKGVIYSLKIDSDFNLFLRDVVKESTEEKFDRVGEIGAEETVESGTIGTDVGTKGGPSEEVAVDSNETSQLGESVAAIVLSEEMKFVNVPWKNIVLVCVHASRDNR